MSRPFIDENGNEGIMKCIHEGLDLDWCDCSDEERERYDVKLRRPEEIPPEEYEQWS